MSFVSPNDHPNRDNPEDPLYYAPRTVRGTADPRSGTTPQPRADQFAPASLSRFDEMREEAFTKFSRPLEAQLAYECRPRRAARHRRWNCSGDWCCCGRGAGFVQREPDVKNRSFRTRGFDFHTRAGYAGGSDIWRLPGAAAGLLAVSKRAGKRQPGICCFRPHRGEKWGRKARRLA